MSVLVVTGPPGAGKSTVARVLAADPTRSALIEADWFWERVVRGWVAPWLPGSEDQNTTMTRALGATVARFDEGGYDVVVEGIVGPWFLATFRSELPAGEIEQRLGRVNFSAAPLLQRPPHTRACRLKQNPSAVP